MNKNKLFNGFYNYTVIATYIGMLCGFCAIPALLGNQIRTAIILLMVAGLFDMFDGKIASTKKNRTPSEKKFGIQIDSLSDIICFGVLPGLITYVISGKMIFSLICGGAYMLCALIRLAYFNVCEEERQQTEGGTRKTYDGLPVTMAAVIFPTFYIMMSILNINPAYVFPPLAAVMAFLFIFAVKLPKANMTASVIMALIGIAELVFICVGVK